MRPIALGLQSVRWDCCRLSGLGSAQADAGTCTGTGIDRIQIHGEGSWENILGEENNLENESCS